MAEAKKVRVRYLGPMSGVVIDELRGLKIMRGETAEVPDWFAAQKLKRAPKSWQKVEETAETRKAPSPARKGGDA